MFDVKGLGVLALGLTGVLLCGAAVALNPLSVAFDGAFTVTGLVFAGMTAIGATMLRDRRPAP